MNICEVCLLKLKGSLTPRKLILAECGVCRHERICTYIPGDLAAKNAKVTVQLSIEQPFAGSMWYGTVTYKGEVLAATSTPNKKLTQFLLVNRALQEPDIARANQDGTLAIERERRRKC